MTDSSYLIIGNSSAAMGAVAGIRNADGAGPITLVARESESTYSRPLISYWLGGAVDDERMAYRSGDAVRNDNLTFRLGVEVTSVDTGTRTVLTSEGESIGFDKLLIATGGKPILPPDVEGLNAEGIFTLTTWADARNIRAFIEKNSATKAVVVGGGLIGLKSVEALVALGVRTSVIELADRVLSATFDDAASDLAAASLSKAGVDVVCGTTISSVQQEKGKVAGVTLRDGRQIPCSLVILAIGVVPDTRILEGSGVELERGVLVNDQMMTSVPGIFAAGDVAQAMDLLSGERRPIPILPSAYRQGFIAGNNMAGASRVYEGGLAMNAVDICGLPTISVGNSTLDDSEVEILRQLDARTPAYRKLVLKDNRIVGAIFMGKIDRAGIVTGLIKEKVDVSGFKHLLMTDEFGLISLPVEYRKHMVAGMGIEV